jgi:hypothetical protein
MKQRSPAAVFLLSLITFGIYALVWEVKTKGELKNLGADIPTAWLLIVPLANLYWVWKYCVGVEKVSNGQISAVLALILMLLLSIVGFAILQSEYNKLSLQPGGAGAASPSSPLEPSSQTVAATPPDVSLPSESDDSPTKPTRPTGLPPSPIQ